MASEGQSGGQLAGRFGLQHHLTRLAHERAWATYFMPAPDSSGRWLTFFRGEHDRWIYVCSKDQTDAFSLAMEVVR